MAIFQRFVRVTWLWLLLAAVIDVDAAKADLIVDNVYEFPMVTHFAIEPHAFIAAPEEDGVVIWTATQNPFQMQRIIARVLGLPVAKVRVRAPDSGGAFRTGPANTSRNAPPRRCL